MVSSIDNDSKTMIEKRERRPGKPNVVRNYSKNTGGVDLGDVDMVIHTDMHCFNVYIIYKKERSFGSTKLVDRVCSGTPKRSLLVEKLSRTNGSDIGKTKFKFATKRYYERIYILMSRL